MDPFRPSTQNADVPAPDNLDAPKPDSAPDWIKSPDAAPDPSGGMYGGTPANPAQPAAAGDPDSLPSEGVHKPTVAPDPALAARHDAYEATKPVEDRGAKG